MKLTTFFSLDQPFKIFQMIYNTNLMIIGQNNNFKVVTSHLSCNCKTGVCGCKYPYVLDSKGCVLDCSDNRTKSTIEDVSICQCPEKFFFLNGKCSSSCAENTFLSNGNVCGKCHPNCKNCTSSHEDSCGQCQDSYILVGKYCVKNSTYKNNANENKVEYTNNDNKNIKLIISKIKLLLITFGLIFILTERI